MSIPEAKQLTLVINNRIGKIAERFGVDPNIVLDNIAYGRALNSEHQMELIEEIGSSFTEGTFRLLVCVLGNGRNFDGISDVCE